MGRGTPFDLTYTIFIPIKSCVITLCVNKQTKNNGHKSNEKCVNDSTIIPFRHNGDVVGYGRNT